jgi:hypothetical protein
VKTNQTRAATLVRATLFLIVIAVVGLMAAGLSACGGSRSSKDELSEARSEGAAEARQQAKIEQIQHQLKALRHDGTTNASSTAPSSSSSAALPGGSSCGGDVSVGANTTCPFAENVEAEYREFIGSGSGAVDAFSPAKGGTITMYCSGSSPHICTGGDEASVYFP